MEATSGAVLALAPETVAVVIGGIITSIDGAMEAAYGLEMIREDLGNYRESKKKDSEDGSETNNKIITSEHAEIRGSQGRNVNTAINDLNKVKPSNVYLQDDGRYVIKGSNGRVHIMEPKRYNNL